MPDLLAVFKDLEKKHTAAANIAGWVGVANNKRTFFYEASLNPNLPAAAYIFDRLGNSNNTVYTNLNNDHWLYTYAASRLYTLSTTGGNTNVEVQHVTELNDRKVTIVGGTGKVGPFKTGGLYQAALSLSTAKKVVSYKVKNAKDKTHTKEKGFHRAMRYYMLAAYALLGKGIGEGYSEGNYICALLVDDTGRILSWGLNNGWFHHGEVNMLLNYFANNPTKTKIPDKALVFSTLTPCQQCAAYLQTVRSAETLIFMGQRDTGTLGRAGEANAQYLRELTDPVRVVSSKGLQNGIEKYPIDATLSSKVSDKKGSIAKKVGQWCSLELAASFDTINRKQARQRQQDLEDQQIKNLALAYLSAWLSSVKLQNTDRKVV